MVVETDVQRFAYVFRLGIVAGAFDQIDALGVQAAAKDDVEARLAGRHPVGGFARSAAEAGRSAIRDRRRKDSIGLMRQSKAIIGAIGGRPVQRLYPPRFSGGSHRRCKPLRRARSAAAGCIPTRTLPDRICRRRARQGRN
jgi:hypothetical protein